MELKHNMWATIALSPFRFSPDAFMEYDKTILIMAIQNDTKNHWLFKVAKYIEELGELSQAILGEIGSANKSKSSGDVLEEIIDIILVTIDLVININNRIFSHELCPTQIGYSINRCFFFSIMRTNQEILKDKYNNPELRNGLLLKKLFDLNLDYEALYQNDFSKFDPHTIIQDCLIILYLIGKESEDLIFQIMTRKCEKWLNKTLTADYSASTDFIKG